MRPLYLIPARGGSKGVPGKNIRPLGGRPLIEHSISHALYASGGGDVVVSTDSREIARIAEKAGAKVPFIRPAELATDKAGSREVMLHAVDALSSHKDYDTVVLLQPTSPFRNPEDIVKALNLFNEKHPDMVVSVKPAATNPYYNAFECRADGTLMISKGNGDITRRQDAPQVWEFDGAIYVISVDSLRRYTSLARMPKVVPLVSSSRHNIDIDSIEDFLVAEQLMKLN